MEAVVCTNKLLHAKMASKYSFQLRFVEFYFIYLLSSLVFILFLFNKKGRLIDLIKKKGTNFLRVTFLVLDEADRMFDMVRINSKFMLKLSYFFLDFYIYFF